MSGLFSPGMRLARWWSQRGLRSLVQEYAERSNATAVHSFLSGSYTIFAGELSERYTYPGLGSGSDYYRGQDVRGLIVQRCTGELS